MECHLASLQRLTCGDKTPLSWSPPAERKTAAGFFCFWRLATNSPFPGSDSQLSALTDLPPTLTTKDLKTSPFVAIIVKLWLREESSKHERLTATLSENPPCSRRWGFNSHILHQIPTGEFDKIQFPRHHKYFLNHWNVAPPLQEAVEDDQVWTKTSCLPGCTWARRHHHLMLSLGWRGLEINLTLANLDIDKSKQLK